MHVIFTLQYRHILFTQWYWVHLGIDYLSFENPSLRSLMFLNSTLLLEWFGLLPWFLYSSRFILSYFVSWNGCHIRTDNRDQCAQRKRGWPVMMHIKATWNEKMSMTIDHVTFDSYPILSTFFMSIHYQPWFISIIHHFNEISRTKFC